MTAAWRAVFLDAGGTLFRPHDTVGAIYAETAQAFGVRVDAQDLERAFQKEWVHAGGLRTLTTAGEEPERAWWRAFVERVFERVGELPEEAEFFEELFDRFARSESWMLYPDTLPALRAFRGSGKRIAVVSNWDSRLFQLCDELGISPHVDCVLASVRVGAAKPDVRIFNEALTRMGVAREQVIHVGDSIEEDVEGARRAGLRPVLIRRQEFELKEAKKLPRGVPCIQSLLELLEKEV